ncbi:MAG: phenylalanine--tRNA ligase subunit beta [Granulosicoccus sp.]|nr:phenylalanine--tRNA ligase subunit beta [Granulosicoccus sp.]
MKFSEKWLREWVDPPVDTTALADQLTFLGLEVDEVTSASPGFNDVVAATIVEINAHPKADRLKICQVDDGSGELLSVVCGAPNARSGLVSALARVGGQLPDGTRLKKAKLRGVESHGMLCSAAELGLADENDGIWELPDTLSAGTDLAQWLELDDAVIDIELTPDRGDCLSIRGIARDLCAKNDLPMALHEITSVVAQTEQRWPVQVHDGCACVRYCSRVISEVDLTVRSPQWMIERLRRAGVRSINVAVDITNYVMLELGQPMHAFDLDKIQGAIQVRHANSDERLLLLDGREVLLHDDTTIIADDSGPVGIGGIMGGESTGVTQDTRHVLFESALFLPEMIAGKPRRYASPTESAHRFERGVDPAGQLEALEYASGLIQTIAGGKAGPVEDWQNSQRLPERPALQVRTTRLQRLLGISPSLETVQTIFTRLGIQSQISDAGWQVLAPSYRYDLQIEEDYIEEVARVLGYDSIPRTFATHTPMFRPVRETEVTNYEIKQMLVERGYQEIVTYSFVENTQQTRMRPDLAALSLANPISSELEVMRCTLVGGLISTYRYNLSRQIGSMRLFETGLRFLSNPQSLPVDSLDDHVLASLGEDLQIDSSVQQQQMLAGLAAGRQQAENWNADNTAIDFYSIKADIERLFARANALPVSFASSDLELLHPAQRAGILIDGKPVGYVGALSPLQLQALDLQGEIFVFEIALDALLHAQIPRVEKLSRFPQVRRDIALLLDEAVSFQSILQTIMQAAPDTVVNVSLFDVYRGDKVEKGKKSMALGLILQDFSRTLEDRDVEQVVSELVAAVHSAHGAVLRV